MRNKQNNSIVKATIKHIIVAFVYVLIIFAIVYILFSNSISRAISLVDMISVNTNKEILMDVKIDLTTKKLKTYPEYGSKYGDIRIPSRNIDLPLYFGDTLSILKNGVGHSSLSYFPGEGGSILCMGHNTANMLKDFIGIKNGEQIIIETTYGKYTYEVYDTKIVNEYDMDSAPIQKEEEILMLYTCYPANSIGHVPDRFFAYARLVDEEVYE